MCGHRHRRGERGRLCFYAPTAFTPDGDGINDVASGGQWVTQYHLRITNRWESWCLKASTLTNLGWERATTGSTIARRRVPLYVAYFDQIGYPREMAGHLTLAR